MDKINWSNIKIALHQALIPMILVVVLPTTVLGWVVSGSTNLLHLLAGILIIAVIDMGGNVLNNIADWEIDEKNKKRIELHKLVSKNQLLLLFVFLFGAAVPFLIIGNAYLKIFILLGYAVAMSYSIGPRLKDRVLTNYINISLFYGPFAFLYGYFAATSDVTNLLNNLWIVFFVFFIDMGFAVTKDYEDTKGDKLMNKLTIPVVYGKKGSLLYQFVVINATFLSALFLILIGWVNLLYLFIIFPYLIALFVLYKVNSTKSKEEYHFAHNLIRTNALCVRFILAIVVWFLLYIP